MRSVSFLIFAGVCLVGCDPDHGSTHESVDLESVSTAELAEQQRSMSRLMKALVDRVQILEEEREGMVDIIAKAEALQKYVSVTPQGDIRISGANLHLFNGDYDPRELNGKGNLLVGPDFGFDQNQLGSHNIVVGPNNEFGGKFGLLVGSDNSTSGFGAIAIGENNHASGWMPAVVGGYGNNAAGRLTSVFGGSGNKSTGNRAGVFGGYDNNSSGEDATVLGGSYNSATHETSSVVASHRAHTESKKQSLFNQAPAAL